MIPLPVEATLPPDLVERCRALAREWLGAAEMAERVLKDHAGMSDASRAREETIATVHRSAARDLRALLTPASEAPREENHG